MPLTEAQEDEHVQQNAPLTSSITRATHLQSVVSEIPATFPHAHVPLIIISFQGSPLLHTLREDPNRLQCM